MIQSIGTIRYRSNWWIWLECDYELGRYLRRLHYNFVYKVCKLGKPSWDEHITVVSSHEKTDKFEQFWGKYEGLSVNFEVEIAPQTNGNAFWMPVHSKKLENIREELGLVKQRMIPLHFAVGYEYPGKVKDEHCRL